MTAVVLGDAAYLPAGCLDRFAAAAQAHATQRADVVVFADSTTVGETQAGGSSNYYSWFSNRLRARFAAAGFTDGGRGLSGRAPSQDFASNSGENLASIQSRSGWAAPGLSDLLLIGFTAVSNTVSDTIRFQGKGTYVRLIWRAARFAAYGKFSYSLDGGAAVTVTPDPTAGYGYVVLGPFTEGTHTLDLVNLGGATDLGDGANNIVSVTPDWFRAAGLVWHNHAVSGTSAGTYVGGNNHNLPISLGLVQPAHLSAESTDFAAAVDGSAGARKARLALFQLGINDGDDTQFDHAISKYATLARNAGADPLVCIPPLEDKPMSNRVARQAAIKAACVTYAVPYVDFGVGGALLPADQWASAYGIGAMSNPHLSPSAYQQQGDFLADVLLSHI